MEKLVGKWSWVLLVSRAAYSVFSSVYSFCHTVSVNRSKLWPSVAKELRIVCGLAPVLCVNIFQEWSSKAAAFDASSDGQGVSERTITVNAARSFARLSGLGPSVREERGCLEEAGGRVEAMEWNHVVSSRFRFKAHINVLEAAACLSSVRRAVKDDRCGKKFVLFGDSASVVAAMAKGRCSSFSLLVAIRRIMALVLATGSKPKCVWIPSASNPADWPSRNG
jgi:hypothetical protein